MKTAIVYASVHHDNTKKIVEGIAAVIPIDLIDIMKNPAPNLSSYDLIGFASGVFFQNMHERVILSLKTTNFTSGQSVFFVCTCGIMVRDYTKNAQRILKQKQVPFAGKFQCRGYDTFGPLRKIGGISKTHPDEKDISKAQQFMRKIMLPSGIRQ